MSQHVWISGRELARVGLDISGAREIEHAKRLIDNAYNQLPSERTQPTSHLMWTRYLDQNNAALEDPKRSSAEKQEIAATWIKKYAPPQRGAGPPTTREYQCQDLKEALKDRKKIHKFALGQVPYTMGFAGYLSFWIEQHDWLLNCRFVCRETKLGFTAMFEDLRRMCGGVWVGPIWIAYMMAMFDHTIDSAHDLFQVARKTLKKTEIQRMNEREHPPQRNTRLEALMLAPKPPGTRPTITRRYHPYAR